MSSPQHKTEHDEENSHMKTIKEHIIEALEQADINHEVTSERVIHVPINTNVGALKSLFMIDEERSMFAIRVQGPVRIAEDKRPKAYAALNELNRKHLFGTMLLDENGDLQIIYACNADDGAINAKTIITPWASMVKTIQDTHDELMNAIYAK